MKRATACERCRLIRRRCMRRGLGQACSLCQSRNLQCSFAKSEILRAPRPIWVCPASQRIAAQSTTIDAPDTTATRDVTAIELLPASTVREMVEHYLTKLHDRPHSLFHPQSLLRSIEDGTIKKALLYSICSLGCRFMATSSLRDLETVFMAESKSLLQADFEHVSVQNIQACILVANLCAAHLQTQSEALYFRMANSIMQIMEVADPLPSCTSAITKEIRRRIWWTLFMADYWCSSGLDLPRQLNYCDRVDLPMAEDVFHAMREDHIEYPIATSWKPGLWAHMITLVQFFGPVMDLNRRCASPSFSAEERDRTVAALSLQLHQWEEMLPCDVRNSTENLLEHKARGLGGPFVALHLGFHHYATLLYFQFLSSPNEPLYARRCKYHARAYSTLLEQARKTGSCEAVYPTVGHMATVSSATLLYTLLFGDEFELADSRAGLNTNFEALIELRTYWPRLTSWQIERLITFQNLCLLAVRNENAQTHQLDRWMLRFLVEHALPLESKVPGLSNMNGMWVQAQELRKQGRFTDFTEMAPAHYTGV
ncbi:hypothetical protein PFICI_04350 [Pestalotiopsis fici W106-1]|uniref:Zn(2)-C6 fungal-type domain-containing protein n=1 Tax=Pestalotiopsis fici (strain W106-1 / CGMCC3.15140) TaxID=1229662 RepID=W3X8W9_PESFW|nr:uncharacterized protein PFICI_04350 [Pestalotiopsis fici W106-1]ETS82474.1 hypothetical protein PFICI_04350 [Pestalotiopsis fici W106-1]